MNRATGSDIDAFAANHFSNDKSGGQGDRRIRGENDAVQYRFSSKASRKRYTVGACNVEQHFRFRQSGGRENLSMIQLQSARDVEHVRTARRQIQHRAVGQREVSQVVNPWRNSPASRYRTHTQAAVRRRQTCRLCRRSPCINGGLTRQGLCSGVLNNVPGRIGYRCRIDTTRLPTTAGSKVTLTGSGDYSFDGTLYAPNKKVVMTGSNGGNQDFVGAITADNFTMSGHSYMHVDEALFKNGSGTVKYVIDSYGEITSFAGF